MLTFHFFHPFVIVGRKRTKAELDDTVCYGIALDFTCSFYFFTYEWGQGMQLRILGFGFELLETHL